MAMTVNKQTNKRKEKNVYFRHFFDVDILTKTLNIINRVTSRQSIILRLVMSRMKKIVQPMMTRYKIWDAGRGTQSGKISETNLQFKKGCARHRRHRKKAKKECAFVCYLILFFKIMFVSLFIVFPVSTINTTTYDDKHLAK